MCFKYDSFIALFCPWNFSIFISYSCVYWSISDSNFSCLPCICSLLFAETYSIQTNKSFLIHLVIKPPRRHFIALQDNDAHLVVVYLFEKSKLKVDHQLKDSKTPLMEVSFKGQLSIVQCLCNHERNKKKSKIKIKKG